MVSEMSSVHGWLQREDIKVDDSCPPHGSQEGCGEEEPETEMD